MRISLFSTHSLGWSFQVGFDLADKLFEVVAPLKNIFYETRVINHPVSMNETVSKIEKRLQPVKKGL